MAFITYIFCIALVCGVRGNPSGQAAVCEHPSLPLPLPLPNAGSTTVCETSGNVLGRGLGYPFPLNYPHLPYPYPRYPVHYDSLGYYPIPNIQPATTVCETTPNVLSLPPKPTVPIPDAGSTTVCETTPNVVGFLPVPNVPVPNVATTTCETTPAVLPASPCVSPLPCPGLLPGYAPYGMPFL